MAPALDRFTACDNIIVLIGSTRACVTPSRFIRAVIARPNLPAYSRLDRLTGPTRSIA